MGKAPFYDGWGKAISSALENSVVGFVDRQSRQRKLLQPRRIDLLVALMCARLANVAYLETQAELVPELNALSDVPGGLKLLYFRRQRAEERKGADDDKVVHPQWFLAQGKLPSWLPPPAGAKAHLPRSRALYLCFRGTWSALDLLRDLCVEPEAAGARSFHGGFLAGIRDDPSLHEQLRRHLRPDDHLYVCGHSMGGSLALTLVASGLLPASHTGPVTAVGVGSPPMILADGEGDGVASGAASAPAVGGGAAAGAAASALPDDGTGEVTCAEPLVPVDTLDRARCLLVVNDADVVPRLLGSPLPVSTAALLASSGGPVLRRNLEVMRTMQRYCHPPETHALLLRDGAAKAVPPAERSAVLHLHEALSQNLIDCHFTHKYIGALEIAAALAEAEDVADEPIEVFDEV